MNLFVGSFFPDSIMNFVQENSKKGIDIAASQFQRALIDGFIENHEDINLVSLPAVRTYPVNFKKIAIKNSKGFLGTQPVSILGFCTLPLIGLISQLISLLLFLFNKKNEIDHIYIYSLKTPYLLSIYLLRLFKKFKATIIIPDLPQYMSESKNLIYRFLKKIDYLIIKICLRKFDSYVVLSEAMVAKLKIESKSWICVEGILSQVNIHETGKYDNFTFTYTGTLDLRYGIKDLVDSFNKLENKDIRLIVCGRGNGETYVKEAAKIDSRIKYLGQVSHESVINIQRQSTVLVNPRQPLESFTKYSFPSKTLEYLNSGTPCIMYKLPSLPKEYMPYLLLIDSSESLEDKMRKVLSIGEDRLLELGKKAESFVKRTKNSYIQVKRIIEMDNK